MDSSSLTAVGSRAGRAGQEKALIPALAAILLGVLLLYGVGFAGSQTIHNAAHDARHAFAFPCH
jgi:cobalt transporter subunit CbtB